MKISSLTRRVLIIGLSALPMIVLAQADPSRTVAKGIGSFAGLIDAFTGTVVKSLATLLFSLALIAFFIGIIEYIWGAREGKAEKIAVGNKFMTYSLLALFVMFSVYGIITFGQGFLCGGKCDNTIMIPDINFKTSGSGNAGTGLGGAGTGGGTGGAGTGGTGTGGTSGGTGVGGTNTSTGSVSTCNGYISNGKCFDDVCPGGCTYTGNDNGGTVQTGAYNDSRFNNTGGNVGTGAYSCSPGFDCTLPGGGSGVCSSDGKSCQSNAVGSGQGDMDPCAGVQPGQGC